MKDRLAIASIPEFENSMFRAIAYTRRQLDERKAGRPAKGAEHELQGFLEALLDLWTRYRSGRLDPKGRRGWGPGRVIVDSEHGDDPYAELMLRIGTYYKKSL